MRKKIIEKLKEEFEGVEFVEIELSKEEVRKEQIKNTFGTQMYEEGLEEVGYFAFIDLCTIANWSHECEYRFYKNENEYEKKIGTWMPNEEIKIEKIKQS